jgi:pantetheine-phosphate adenylyltransferase
MMVDAQPGHAPRVAVYPGSFDPLTNGHVDIIHRGARLFDRIVVAVLVNEQKRPLFSTDERMTMLRDVFADQAHVEVDAFDGLLVAYAARRGATAIVRGLRAVADFDYELQMTLMNRHLDERIDTVFMMPSEQFSYISSRLVKEVLMLGGSVRGLVPPAVEARLEEKRRQARGEPS